MCPVGWDSLQEKVTAYLEFRQRFLHWLKSKFIRDACQKY